MTIIKKFDTQPTKQHSSGYKKYTVFGVVILLTLGFLEVWMNNTVVSSGQKYEKISQMQQKLVLENQILENQVEKKSSLIEIATRSAELGFTRAKNVQYLQ